MRIYFGSILLFLIFVVPNVSAQKNVTTVGVQYKPIFPLNFLGTGKQASDAGTVRFVTEQTSGFSGGLFIRHNFSDLVGLEGGINYVKRKFTLTISDTGFVGESNFRIIGYEIPVSVVIYARIGEKLYANGSLGPSLDMFASDIITFDTYFRNNAARRSTFQGAVNANLGFEYRTEKSGSFYIGASYHRPFTFIYAQATEYKQFGKKETVYNALVGNYLTIDLRYFFHEDPKNKKKKS
jgi:hypothetical protein